MHEVVSHRASEHRAPRSFRSLGLGALVFLGLCAAAHWEATITAWLRLPEGGEVDRWYVYVTRTAAWLTAAWIVNWLLDRFVWTGIVERATGGPVPRVLREMAALLVYLATVTAVVGLVYGQSIGAFLAAMGAGGVVLGFALRGLFADLFTGLAVNLDRNFAIGDWVTVESAPGGGSAVTGRIVEIGWRCTRLATEEGTMLMVPNSVLGLQVATNISRPLEATRYVATLRVDYSVPCERVRRILLAALKSLETTTGFVREREPKVLVEDAGELGVEYLMRYWILPWNPLSPTTARDRVMSRALQHLAVAGITPAYPKTDIFHAPMPTRQLEDLTIDDRTRLLKRVDLFESLEAGERERLAGELRRTTFERGDIVFRRGDEGESLFVVVEGVFDVRLDDDAEQPLARLAPGDFFGEMSLLTAEPRSATISAATAGVLYEIDRETVARLIEERPVLSELITRAVAERQLALKAARSRDAETGDPESLEGLAGQLLRKMKNLFHLGV